MITCAYKRSVPAEFLHCRSIRTSRIDNRLLQNMLEKRLLTNANLIELIHINQ